MEWCRSFVREFAFVLAALSLTAAALAQGSSARPSSPSSSSKHVKKAESAADSGIDTGAVSGGIYRNQTLALACKIPEGWVLRTDEMNARGEGEEEAPASAKPADPAAGSAGGKVLLAAFSRPPEARGEDVNASILIAAESASAYPGLKEAVQYFGPLTEVAKAQGFTVDEEPYEIAVGTKNLVRADFHKDVGSRVMRQSTLVMLAHGYAVSITMIGGTEDEVEELIDGLSFGAGGK